jgi:hypothetical protein
MKMNAAAGCQCCSPSGVFATTSVSRPPLPANDTTVESRCTVIRGCWFTLSCNSFAAVSGPRATIRTRSANWVRNSPSSSAELPPPTTSSSDAPL